MFGVDHGRNNLIWSATLRWMGKGIQPTINMHLIRLANDVRKNRKKTRYLRVDLDQKPHCVHIIRVHIRGAVQVFAVLRTGVTVAWLGINHDQIRRAFLIRARIIFMIPPSLAKFAVLRVHCMFFHSKLIPNWNLKRRNQSNCCCGAVYSILGM